MDHPAFFFIPSVLALGLAVAVTLREAKSTAHRFFVVGLALLSVETALPCISSLAITADERVFFQKLRIGAAAFLPVAWVSFSLSYSRGNSQLCLKKWRPLRIALLLIPAALLLIFPNDIVVKEGLGE